MAKRKGKTFEELLEETESLVDALEDGTLPLEASLKAYEKGVANLRICATLLRKAEEAVSVLVGDAGDTFSLEPFEADAESEGDADDSDDDSHYGGEAEEE